MKTKLIIVLVLVAVLAAVSFFSLKFKGFKNPPVNLPNVEVKANDIWTLGSKELDTAVIDYLLSNSQFSWKMVGDSTNFCVFQNLYPERKTSPYYIWVRCGEYILENGKIKELSGVSTPAKIEYTGNTEEYETNKFVSTIPRSGSLYDGDVKTIFPREIQNRLNFDNAPLNQKILEKARILEKAGDGTNVIGEKTVTFYCAEEKNITASFYIGDDKFVDLILNDKSNTNEPARKISLPRAMSGSGARYAKADESMVFWNKGDTAFVEENGVTTFKDCALK